MTTEHEPLAADIEIKLAQDYPTESLSAVSRSLATYQGSERNRVIRCIIHLSGRDPRRISYFVGVAAQDYRDTTKKTKNYTILVNHLFKPNSR
jgi:hypothetical protein